MRSVKFGHLFFIVLALLSTSAYAQENQLKGYTPPPMFGGSSTPLSEPPVVSAPAVASPVPAAPAPVIPAPAPVQKTPAKVTTPPADKEQIVKDEPLPIKPLTPKKPQKPTLPPEEKNSAPKYVAPAPKAPKPAPVAKPEPVAAPAPAKEIVAPGINAETLLNHAVTSQPSAPPVNPLAVPASSVEDGLPLPGSVKAKQKKVEKKTDKKVSKKAEKKTAKIEPKKKPVEKPTEKKEIKKAEPKKPVAKPVEKTAVKKAEIKTEPKKEPVAKPAVGKVSDLPVPTGKPVTPVKSEVKAEVKKQEENKSVEPYNIKGRKSMPKISPTKVDREEVAKLPLPAIADPAVRTLPSPNEKIIDKVLEERLVEPDVKKIISEDGVSKTKAKEKPKLQDTPGMMPPPASMATPEEKKEAGYVKPELISLEFVGATDVLKPDQKKVIDGSIIPKLNKDDSRRLQILSYASASKEGGLSSARRISLTRALSIRSYLLEKGMQPSRIDIRALGDNTKEKPLDRVDLVIVNLR